MSRELDQALRALELGTGAYELAELARPLPWRAWRRRRAVLRRARALLEEGQAMIEDDDPPGGGSHLELMRERRRWS